MSKLTRDMRIRIAKNAVAKLHKKHEAIKVKLRKMMEQSKEQLILNSIGTAAERRKMNALPEGWMKEKNNFEIKEPNIKVEKCVINGNGIINWKCQKWEFLRQFNFNVHLKDGVRLPDNKSYRVDLAPKDVKLFFDYQDAYNHAYQTFHTIYNNLKAYKTVEDMKKAWPEGKKFWAGVTPEQVVALAVRWDGINKDLGVESSD